MVSANKKVSQLQATSEDDDVESFEPASNFHKREQSLVNWTLPKLDVEMDGEMNFWKKEVARLVNVANNSNAILLSGEDAWFGEADGDGYTNLHKVALQLQDALDICIHDNELLLLEHMPSQTDHQSYSNARSRLLRDYDPETAKERFQRHLRLDNNNDRYYHALVNYLTAMMLRVMLRTMRGALWEEHCVVTIAKFAAKLKLLLSDLPHSASICLKRTEEVRFRATHNARVQRRIGYEGEREDQDIYEPDVDAMRKEKDKKDKKEIWQPARVDAEMRYFIVTKTFNLGISRLLLSALANLSSNEDTEMSADVFDTTVLMYEDYITNRRLILCSQRDGTIGAAADQRVIASAGAAFKVCLDVWKYLSTSSKGNGIVNEKYWTMLSWKWTELDPTTLDPQPDHITSSAKLVTMKGVISAFVPYSMVCGSFPSLLQDLSNNASLIADPTAPVKLVRQNPFLAALGVRTSAYMSRRMDLFKDDDACNISQSYLAREKALTRSATDPMLTMFADERKAVSDQTLRSQRDQQRRDMAKAMQEFQTWMIDETTIVIPNKRYAWGFLGGCLVLVLGGMAMGLSVGNRIEGVDPLGFATYCWVLAGFVLLVAKSMRVENWPWSRFFRGQVVCRSLREVVSVTRMDAQTILAILLRLEPRMNLIKRGPFNAVFSKQGAAGFAIDVPFRTSTLMEGGLILVKVQSVVGDALVGIRSDLWTRYDAISPKGDNEKTDKVVCRDFLDPGTWASSRIGGRTFPLYTLSRSDIQWFRVVGLFEKDAFFN
ncbi:uncharacterized protein N0V89_008087 [Didymosphaeria variabile]|uniref:Uncharacterized protein n=1 Tax=Didymosphaeria variabile TaxID=1932322 RepID=A0A9W8XGY1_9PLEO|nr:uncharacterized protein N0V89_008087 [Didymosphaeria variabile]KAJ4349472.1 hypothetical protein N0V89_008087 [Didymosphaeria variabile]